MYTTICLISPPWVQRSHSLWERVEGKNIPFGLGYIAAVLERDSHAEVSIIDAKAADFTLQETLQNVIKISPDIVGISCFTYDFNDGVVLAQMIKDRVPDTTICFGGMHASVLPEATLKKDCIDFVV